MRFRLLGAFEATSDGVTVEIGRRRERLLLALLLLEPGRVVSMDRLTDLLWPEEPPPQARTALHAHVSRIRRVLRGLPGAPEITTSGQGYAAHVAEPGSVDAHRFQELLQQARGVTDAAARSRVLREALDLWHGPALSDLAGDELRRRLCLDLEELRAVTLESWLATELELGHHHERIPDAARGVQEFPGRERLVRLHMLALHRAGRSAEAGGVFTDFRRRLGEQMGIEPSQDLRDLHVAILRGDESLLPRAPALLSAHGLPPRPDGFAGRAEQLAALDEPDSRLMVLHGVGGVGKTALAVQWAHASARRFPEGITYLNLRGYGDRPTGTDEAIERMLAPLPHVPGDRDEREQLYHRHMTGRRLLILDDVDSADQVRALIPADPAVLVLALSRNALDGLAVHQHARRIAVPPLPAQSALRLIAHVGRLPDELLGDSRLLRLVELCDRLPLAIRIIGCRLAADDVPDLDAALSELEHEEDRLLALEIDAEDGGMRAVFETMYRVLAPDPARLFRLLGCSPCDTWHIGVVEVLAGQPRARVRRALASLQSSHLVHSEHGSIGMHGLIRIFARERALAETPPDQRDEAFHRLADWYLDTAFEAYPLLSPRRSAESAPAIKYPPEVPLRFANRTEAMSWFGQERDNLAVVVRELGRREWDRRAWQLAVALFTFYQHSRLWTEGIAVYRAALESARRECDAAGQVRILNGLGVAGRQLGRIGEAIGFFQEALVLAEPAGNPMFIGHLKANLAGALIIAGRFDEARAHLEDAAKLPDYSDDPRYSPVLWLIHGELHFLESRLTQAEACYMRGLEAAERSEDLQISAYLHHGAAEVQLQLGNTDRAVHHARRELEIARTIDDPLRQGYGLDLLASLTMDSDPGAATDLWLQARDITRKLAHPLADDISSLLTDLPAAPGRTRECLAHRRFRLARMP